MRIAPFSSVGGVQGRAVDGVVDASPPFFYAAGRTVFQGVLDGIAVLAVLVRDRLLCFDGG